jgi:programmed cell death protein 5
LSSDNELDSIRRRRLIELRQQLLEEQRKNEQILTSEARQRLNRIKLVKPDFASQIELQLIQIAQSGRVRLPINDEQLKQILIKLRPVRREIRFRRM